MKKFAFISLSVVLCLLLISCGRNESGSHGGSTADDIEASLKEFENRKKFSSLNAEILKSIPDDRVEMAVLDYITDVKLKGHYSDEYRIIKGLNRGLQYIYITSVFEGEMNSGGFIQYFYNTSGVFADDLADALRKIGAFKAEKIAFEAVSVYNKEKALHDNMRNKGDIKSFMRGYSESHLEKLDRLFYESAEDLSRLRIMFIRGNPELFTTD